MGLCCLATSMENGYRQGVVTGALIKKKFSFQFTMLPVAFDLISDVK